MYREPPTLVIYHGGCPDGFCSAWVVWKELDGDVELYPAAYNTEPPDVRGRDVYVVDFSYPREVLERMYEDAASLIVLDHHATAEAALKGLHYAHFDMNESGASITWKHFHGGTDADEKEMPWVVKYVRDRDLWRFKLPQSEAVAAYLMALPHDVDEWNAVLAEGFNATVQKGLAIRRHIEKYIEDNKQRAFAITVDDIPMLCVNAPYSNISDLLHSMCSDEYPAALGFFWSGERWVYSLRSINHVDVSMIAMARGGGGHKNAAGFTSDRLLIPEIARVLHTVPSGKDD